MERGLKAAALFALIVVASADRALLAGKPSGGALHAVALTGVASNGQANPNYYITNGNGTWTYSYYSNNGNVNGNNAGQGSVTYASVNSAFGLASGAGGTVAAANAAAVFTAAPAVPNTGTVASLYATGLNAITFPSRNLGVAVGAAIGVANTGANIVMTIDGGLTWLRPTGLPTVTAAPGGLAAGLNQPLPPAGATGQATLAYPAVSVGDLAGIFFASKTTGWACGGNSIMTTTTVITAGQTADLLPAGIIYMTTNGGTIWKNVPLFYTQAQLATAAASGANGATAVNTILSTFVPGFLFGIASDAAGKNVYSVGSAGMTGSANFVAGATPWTTTYLQQTTPTILYSGNSGLSWVHQAAPAVGSASGAVPYALLSVAVQKGSTAWAVGGSISVTFPDAASVAVAAALATPTNVPAASAPSADGSNGQIVYTTNGGFSWNQAVFPSNTGINAPVFTSVVLNAGTVWVGGFLKTSTSDPTGGKAYYPVAAVAGATGVTAVNGQGYTVLISTDGKNFVGAAAYATFPAGFIQTSGLTTNVPTITNFKHVFGITWDNANRGYIYGLGFIMATQDGGKTWVFESPSDLVSTAGQLIKSLANVPTSY